MSASDYRIAKDSIVSGADGQMVIQEFVGWNPERCDEMLHRANTQPALLEALEFMLAMHPTPVPGITVPEAYPEIAEARDAIAAAKEPAP